MTSPSQNSSPQAPASTTPVLVGVGQVSQRFDDPTKGVEPLEMMLAALRAAGADAEAPALLARADSIRVIKGLWRYEDPAREIARRLGAGPVETVGTPFGGNFSQACVSDAARQIAAGEREVVLIAGAENGRSRPLARRQGIKLPVTATPGVPDRMLGDEKPMAHEAELARNIQLPTEMYTVFENALRFARGETFAEQRRRTSELWAGMNRVAQGNPHAWIRKPYSAEEIATVSDANPMIGFPYPRLMNSNSRVDMGAALIVTSLGVARTAGVPDEKLVYLHAATDANDVSTASERQDFHRSPAMRLAGRRVLELAGVSVDDVQYMDVYSCFPSAVQIAIDEIGISAQRPLTVTGGLTFGGGPLNDYVLHSIARMAEVLRADPGSFGLVTGNGGMLSKHAFGVYSTAPPAEGFRYANLQSEVDAEPRRQATVDWTGPATVESYTVMFDRGEPAIGHFACLTPQGARTWASSKDPELLKAMTEEEYCGRSAVLDGSGGILVG